MVHTGQPRDDYVDIAVRHVFFKQGIMGVKVKIMLPYDSTGKNGCPILLPDAVTIRDPKVQEEEEIRAPVVVNQTS
jgi:small subunit ribosomal protein S3e